MKKKKHQNNKIDTDLKKLKAVSGSFKLAKGRTIFDVFKTIQEYKGNI